MIPADFVVAGGAAATSLVIAVVGVFKRAFPGLNWARFGPLVDVVVGIILVWSFVPLTGDRRVDVRDVFAIGLAAGLSASGLYDGAKRVTGHDQNGGTERSEGVSSGVKRE